MRDQKIIPLAILTVLLISVGFIWGCGSNDSPSPQVKSSEKVEQPVAQNTGVPSQTVSAVNKTSGGDPAVTVLRVPWPGESTTPSLYVVAQELGIAKKHNIEFEFAGVIPSTQLVAAVVSGQIDIGGAHINRTIAGISAGAKILAVVAGTETSQRVPHMIGIVKKNSPIKTPEDLLGKKIGIALVGGCHEYTPYAWLDNNGIKDPKTKVEITIIPERTLEQTLRQGEIDMAMMHKIPEEIIRNGEFDIVFSDYDVWGTIGGNTPPYFTIQYIKDHPEAVRNFVAAMAETMNWANAHPQETKEISGRITKVDLNRMVERYFAPNGIIKPETAQIWVELLTQFEEIRSGIALDQIYTNKFNPYNTEAS